MIINISLINKNKFEIFYEKNTIKLKHASIYFKQF